MIVKRAKVAFRNSVPPVADVNMPACPVLKLFALTVKLKLRFHCGALPSWLYLPTVRLPHVVISPLSAVSADTTSGPEPSARYTAEHPWLAHTAEAIMLTVP